MEQCASPPAAEVDCTGTDGDPGDALLQLLAAAQDCPVTSSVEEARASALQMLGSPTQISAWRQRTSAEAVFAAADAR
eukprot:SAG31_NODE_5797_length_2323_cov_3.180842_3_plen_78_part_00